MSHRFFSNLLSLAVFLCAFGGIALPESFACLVCAYDLELAGGFYCAYRSRGGYFCSAAATTCRTWSSCERNGPGSEQGIPQAVRQAPATEALAAEACRPETHAATADSVATQAFASLDPATLLQIAEKHPRFAAALAELRMSAGEQALEDYFTLYMLPVSLTAQKITSLITPSADVLEKVRAESQQAYDPTTMTPTEYKIMVDYSPAAQGATIKLHVIGGSALHLDPPYSSLEITMGQVGTGQWHVHQWSIN